MFLRRIVNGKAFLLGRNVRKNGWMGGGQILLPDRRSTRRCSRAGCF